MKIVYTELLAKSNAGQEKVGPKIHLGQRVKKVKIINMVGKIKLQQIKLIEQNLL